MRSASYTLALVLWFNEKIKISIIFAAMKNFIILFPER